MPQKPMTRLQRLLAHYSSLDQCKPISYNDLLIRSYRLANLASIYGTKDDFLLDNKRGRSANKIGFNRPEAPTLALISNMLGSSNYFRGQLGNSNEPAPLELQMLLLLYEAKPRMASLSNLGWSQRDFVLWIYQDVFKRFGFDDEQDVLNLLMQTKKPSREDKLSRIRIGIARRVTAAFGRYPVSFHKWMVSGKPSTRTVAMLFAKLLEADDEQGYTRAQEPDFRIVRDDFFALVNFIYQANNLGDFDQEYPAPEILEGEHSFFANPIRISKKNRDRGGEDGDNDPDDNNAFEHGSKSGGLAIDQVQKKPAKRK
tara:strand:+ start:21104 stop:22045 length:942 start_codon:yes stop_codon:yes gene_type:complete